jgi:hypothetical protein
MNWACTIQGKSLRLEDIDIGTLGEIARQFEMDWVRLIYFPFTDDRAAKALVIKCAEILGVDPPAPVDGPWPAKVVIDAFETVPEDLPDNFDEDGLPIQVVVGDQATG